MKFFIGFVLHLFLCLYSKSVLSVRNSRAPFVRKNPPKISEHPFYPVEEFFLGFDPCSSRIVSLKLMFFFRVLLAEPLYRFQSG